MWLEFSSTPAKMPPGCLERSCSEETNCRFPIYLLVLGAAGAREGAGVLRIKLKVSKLLHYVGTNKGESKNHFGSQLHFHCCMQIYRGHYLANRLLSGHPPIHRIPKM